MNKYFKYSVLKYVHSQFRGEEFNIGILFYFPNNNSIIFKYPKKIKKFKYIYPSFSESKIKTYLESFENKAYELSNSFNYIENFDQIINLYFLVKESSTLQFSELKEVVLYSDDIDDIIKQYFDLYFSDEIGIKLINSLIRTDRGIIDDFKKKLEYKDIAILKYLKPALEIKNDVTHFKGDIVWQNHTTNIVKGVSLDLDSEERIINKALLYNAKLNFLSSVAIDQNIRFDLLIAKPRKENLSHAYDNAIQILEDISSPKDIIKEENIDNYVSKTVSELER